MKPVQGATGEAKFDNNSTEIRKGNGNHTLKIKGITESSGLNKMTIEATPANASNILDHKEFTVATITSLVFQKFDTDYVDLDTNLGNGQTGSAGGERIFPDKKDVADVNSGKDRALVKVKATVSPTLPNVQVYFGTFDLDDPSANAAPIDTNMSNGNDNNGAVNTSTAGDFTIPTGINCSDPTTGHVPGRIGCAIASDGTAIAAFKTTMQPGDNFAIAASLTNTYRDGIHVNSTDGAKLIDAANKTIPITGTTNTDNVPAIRTDMLTVWRKLHIEVDSMGQAHENYVRGSISGSQTITSGRSRTLNLLSPTNLEVNRFENGRMELAAITNVLEVVSNTANTVTVQNTTASDITITSGVNYELANGTRSALGTVSSGITISPMQIITLDVNSIAPMETNDFSNGMMNITPLLRSLNITSNTANSVDVTNNGTGSIVIPNNTHFRLYDDDDMDDNAPPIPGGKLLDGDEGDDVPEPNTDLLQPNDTACTLDVNGKITNLCNVFLSAYVRPADNFLSGSQNNIQFDSNLTNPEISALYAQNFANISNEANPDFWTVYLFGANQLGFATSNSPEDWDADPDLNATTRQGNSFAFGTVDALNGIGATIFTELNRPKELENINIFNSLINPSVARWQDRPIGAKYTVAHELGHLFYGEHNMFQNTPDSGLMAEPQIRSKGNFSDTSINRIRGGIFTDYQGTSRKITHP